jgi:hypothetical protein
VPNHFSICSIEIAEAPVALENVADASKGPKLPEKRTAIVDRRNLMYAK